MKLIPIWFDSLGAKSSCVLVETDRKILIDPGVAVMHPSFPASSSRKIEWYKKARRKIKEASKGAEIVVVTHYHYDHFTDFDREMYSGKVLLTKNPNEYINDSQRKRAEKFFGNICREFSDGTLGDILEEPREKDFGDPMEDLELAKNMNFGDYTERRNELLEKGRKWFFARAKNWCKYKRIPEFSFENIEVKFIDGRKFKFGKTKVRFTKPFFHGIEFSRVGWVCSVVVEYGGEKLIHTSDLNGPIIEDYADWIISEDPDYLILDGPMTYMLGYTLNLINFRRCISNACRILEESNPKLIIYDHHLPREPKFRERTYEVWELGENLGRRIVTCAELFGLKPAVLS